MEERSGGRGERGDRNGGGDGGAQNGNGNGAGMGRRGTEGGGRDWGGEGRGGIVIVLGGWEPTRASSDRLVLLPTDRRTGGRTNGPMDRQFTAHSAEFPPLIAVLFASLLCLVGRLVRLLFGYLVDCFFMRFVGLR